MVKKCLDALLNALFAVIGLIGKIFRLLHREREAVPTTSASVKPATPSISNNPLPNPAIPSPKPSKEQEFVKALQLIGNRQNNWDLKIIYAHAHLESSIWNDKSKKMSAFTHPITQIGNNFWGIKKSSIWDKFILNPLDKQYYCRFDDPAEAVGFYDLFIKRGYPDSYKNRNSYRLFFPLLRQGKFGAFCPLTNYADNCIIRYEQLPIWENITKCLKNV